MHTAISHFTQVLTYTQQALHPAKLSSQASNNTFCITMWYNEWAHLSQGRIRIPAYTYMDILIVFYIYPAGPQSVNDERVPQ